MTDFRYISNRMVIFSLAYFLVIVAAGVVIASRGFSNSLFDYVSNLQIGGSASAFTLSTGVLPLFAVVIPLLIDQKESDMIVIRMKKKEQLFYQHFIFSVLISVLFTLLMAAGGIIGSLLEIGHIGNLWDAKEGAIYFLLDNKSFFPFYAPEVTTVKVWAYLLSSRFLATLFIATCVIFLKCILKKNSYVFFAAIILIGTDGIFPERYSLFLGRASIEMDTWIDHAGQLFNLVYFVLGIVIFFFACLKMYEKKEFYH